MGSPSQAYRARGASYDGHADLAGWDLRIPRFHGHLDGRGGADLAIPCASRAGYALSWTICCATGVLALAIWGFQRSGDRRLPRAALWPRTRLALGFVACLAITAWIMWDHDRRVCEKVLALRDRAIAEVRAAAPPPARPDALAFMAEAVRESLDVAFKRRGGIAT